MSTDYELGKDRPCYGEFECSNCRRRWHSTKTWAGYGQNCKDCDALVHPGKLSKNFVYICLKCQAMWHSSYSASGLKCKKCHLSTLISPLDPDNSQDQKVIEMHKSRAKNADSIPNPNGEHDEALCEKCRVSGQPCRNTARSHMSTPMTHTSEYNNKVNTDSFTKR